MKTYTEEQVMAFRASGAWNYELGHDSEGQLIIYTGIFIWSDGSFHDEPEEKEGEGR